MREAMRLPTLMLGLMGEEVDAICRRVRLEKDGWTHDEIRRDNGTSLTRKPGEGSRSRARVER
jgi:hypothetical protein